MKYTLAFVSLIFLGPFCYSQDTTRLSLLFLGDIMQHDSQINDAWNPVSKKYDYTPCFKYVKPYTQSVDLAIGNLELTLAGPPFRGYPQFSAPDELLFALKDMGMDVLVTANNHCVDTGKKGLERTITMLDSLDIPHTGTFVDQVSKLNDHPLMVEKNGFKLAILNYTFSTNGLPVAEPNIVNRIDTAAIRLDLIKAKRNTPDAIIVFTHWGNEYQSLPSAWQKIVGEHCFKHGATVVIGAHPHVLQPMEWRKEKNQLIAYSLGNFVSGQRKRYTDGGGMIKFSLEKITSVGDSTSATKITNPEYILEWVYRTNDAEKNYFVLPVPTIEHDTTNIIRDQLSREALKIFIEDSRKLFSEHNLNIQEAASIPPDSLTTFKVEFATIGKDSAEFITIAAPVPYDVQIDYDSIGNKHYYSGEFTDHKEAARYQRKLISSFGLTNARVVRFVNGRRKDD
jgi:poly-gamma-glutamate capsule biosynthesis protein CapA/YwtB (metallophosphatase superfamily)